MNELFVDAGNSFVKWRQVQSPASFCASVEAPDFFAWIESQRESIDFVVVSSVQSEAWNTKLKSLCGQIDCGYWFAESVAESNGLVSAYIQPDHLGVDRWLAMLAIWVSSQSSFLLVDSGTAITLDLVDNDGRHQGGFILPGFDMQRQALLGKSEKINHQLSEYVSLSLDYGRDTTAAIENGMLASIVALVEKIMSDTNPSPEQLVFAGGSGKKLQKIMGGTVGSDLVLQGLEILWQQYLDKGFNR